MNDIVQLEALVKGNVQGVGFRRATKYLADDLRLTGFVRNLPDGSVEICAQGEKNQLETFLSVLKEKFSASHIDAIETHFCPPAKTYPDFRIVH